jgi:Mce-associated membrane protein
VSIDLSKDTGETTEPDSTASDAAAHGATASGSARPPVDAVEGSAGRSVAATTVTAVMAVFLVIAMGAAVWFGTGWVRAAFFTDGPRAGTRDSALSDARQAAINLLSLDPNDVDGSIKLIQSSMTGQLLDDATKTQDQFREQAKQAKTKLETKVLGSTISSLNSERDHASALIVLQVTRTAPNVAPYAYRQTWSLDLVKQGEVWKAEKASPLGQPIPMNTANAEQPATTTPGQPAPPKPGS